MKITKTKLIVGGLVLLLLIYGGFKYFGGGQTGPSYVTAATQKGSIIVSVSGSGQVAAINQIDLKAKASGDVISIGAKDGETVVAGTLLASLDNRTAEIDLENARLALAKLTEPADAVALGQAKNDLADAEQANKKSYDDALNAVVSAFVDLPDVMTGLDSALNTPGGYLYSENLRSLGDVVRGYRDAAGRDYLLARGQYDLILPQYRTINRTSATGVIESFVADSYQLAKVVAQAVKEAKNTVTFIQTYHATDYPASATAVQANLASWTDKTNSAVLNLAAASEAMASSGRAVKQQTEALAKLVRGADPLDIQTAELNLKQKQYAYDNYFIRAPFGGVITKFSLKLFDSVSTGSVVATLLTEQREADISLNEVDAANVKIGQKATLTFDAVPGLSLTGQVTQLDQIGTITQGVVNYNAKITFDTSDKRVKPGMSVTADIITDVKTDVLTVPNSAVKTQGNTHYVETLVNGAPAERPVEIGLANDTATEITSGLTAGEQIITRTVSQTAPAAQAPSIFGAVGGNRGLGGARRQ